MAADGASDGRLAQDHPGRGNALSRLGAGGEKIHLQSNILNDGMANASWDHLSILGIVHRSGHVVGEKFGRGPFPGMRPSCFCSGRFAGTYETWILLPLQTRQILPSGTRQAV